MNGSRLFIWWPSTDRYAVPASHLLGSMLEIVPHSIIPVTFAVTLVHVAPLSRVTWTRPSLVPAQINPLVSFDSAIANTTPAYSTPMLSGVRPPEIRCRDLSLRVRSGESSRQCWPPSVVTCTC